MTMTPLDLFGLFAVILMLVFYALERRHHIFILLFSLSCLLGSAYGFMQGAWPFGVVELVWTVVVGWRWWHEWRALTASRATLAGCMHCGHVIGHHWGDERMCTVAACHCPGYAEAEPARR
ncbi:MAG: hypothetical protein Q7T61_07705 [Caulobacter sp.]|nr:hypothetical protein [Caulobacter sp.]